MLYFPFHIWDGVYQYQFCCSQGFVTSVSHMRSFVPAIYDVTVAIPKSSPAPTMLRLFKGQSSTVSKQFFISISVVNLSILGLHLE